MMRGVIIPSDVEIAITRNYGETAADKSNELLWHMFLAVVSVSALILVVRAAVRQPSSSRRFL
jgi:hypothetical protein